MSVSTNPTDRFYKYCDALISAASVQDKFDVWQAQIQRYGFERSLYGSSAKMYDKAALCAYADQDLILVSSYAPEVHQFYEDGGLEDDISVDEIFTESSTYLWEDAHVAYQAGDMDDEQRKVHELTSDYGIDVGVTIEIEHVSSVGFSGIGLCHDPKMPLERFHAFWQENARQVRVAAQIFDWSVTQQRVAQQNNPLTGREREVLLWAASGLLNAQIADRLAVKETTVNLHIRNAKKKLDAQTLAGAVYTAHARKFL